MNHCFNFILISDVVQGILHHHVFFKQYKFLKDMSLLKNTPRGKYRKKTISKIVIIYIEAEVKNICYKFKKERSLFIHFVYSIMGSIYGVEYKELFFIFLFI